MLQIPLWRSYFAGCILLGIAPCTAMVLVWGYLSRGNDGLTLVMVAINSLTMLVLYGVLGGFLRNGFLHTAIREKGGAYGGGASQDSTIAAFRFFSYRDPRLADTLADFDRALAWLATERHEPQRVEEAILGVIGGIDKPGSPAGEAKQTFHAELHGRDRTRRERFRNRVLQVGLADLQRVAATYLRPERASTAVITAPDRAEQLAALNLNPISL
jgi:hypothetical protein